MKSQDNVPIYKRMDRHKLEARRLQIELSNIQRGGHLIINLPPIPANSIRLSRFFAEGDAEIELVLGLSQELGLPRREDGLRKTSQTRTGLRYRHHAGRRKEPATRLG